MKNRCIIALLVFLLCAAIALGQDARGTVQGLVSDSSDAVIVGAHVTLLNLNTGVSVVKDTNSTGNYRFDFVSPGTYSVTAEYPGFNKSVEQNVLVQTRGDVTVDLRLQAGGTAESITVNATAVELQFNTSSRDLVVDRKQLMEMPVVARNPFTLAMLDPAVQNMYGTMADRNPFFMWAASTVNVGGRTSRQNDLLIDGAPVQIGPKGSYTPTMDAVQEFSVQQNSVDAEFGNTAGGVISLAMREGTNELHGSAYYFGRNPALNAVTNSITRSKNEVRNHNWGGSIGGPLRRNRLFTFFAYEGWKTKDPLTSYFTLPTSLERTGDFSKSLNAAGSTRLIYDPLTTKLVGNTATRQPFANNVIPTNRIDPTASKMMTYIWEPNTTGDAANNVNNFKASYSGLMDYWNFSDRTDWNITDNLRVFGRYSQFSSQLDMEEFTGKRTPAMPNGRAGLMTSKNAAADLVYSISPNTILNARGSYTGFRDNYNAPNQKFGVEGLSSLWNSAWYTSYAEGAPDIYFPALNIGPNSFGTSWYYIQEPESYNFSGKLSRYVGKHTYKTGVEVRHQRVFASYPDLMAFNFGADMTAATYLNPDTSLSGDPYATFLLGALSNDSYSNSTAYQQLSLTGYGVFFHDDYRVHRNVTLNLGLRYEYETAPVDEQNRYSRALDLGSPIPEMQGANAPVIPEYINQMRGKAAVFNGAWQFTDENNRAPFTTSKTNFMPRAGVAIRLNDRTAFQAGYARYIVPRSKVQDGIIGPANFPGFSVGTNPLPALEGVPQAWLSDPYPSGRNPLQPVVGKSLGRYTNLGNGFGFHNPNYVNGKNDRFNFTLQRELPGGFKGDVTFFMHFANDVDITTTWDARNMNMVDPNIVYARKGELQQTVPNPFYQFSTPDKFPGQLRNQQMISVYNLLRTYPQYGDLWMSNVNGGKQRHKALQFRLQRAYSNGLSLLWGYNYQREQIGWFKNEFNWWNFEPEWRKGEQPRHRTNVAATYDFPFGKGRPWLHSLHPVINAVLGGWSTSSLLTIQSGTKSLFFGSVDLVGDPRIDNPTRERRWNTSAFRVLPAFTPRTAPLVYDGVGGPRRWNLDSTLSKNFPIKERMKLEFRAEAYNLTNSFIWADPDRGVTSATFGRCLYQYNRGRELQGTLRLIF